MEGIEIIFLFNGKKKSTIELNDKFFTEKHKLSRELGRIPTEHDYFTPYSRNKFYKCNKTLLSNF